MSTNSTRPDEITAALAQAGGAGIYIEGIGCILAFDGTKVTRSDGTRFTVAGSGQFLAADGTKMFAAGARSPGVTIGCVPGNGPEVNVPDTKPNTDAGGSSDTLPASPMPSPWWILLILAVLYFFGRRR